MSVVQRLFGTPVSPYTKVDKEFRERLHEKGKLHHFQGIITRLGKRYGLRLNSVGQVGLYLTVILAGTYVYFDTVSDTITSVEKWARVLFLPALWVSLYSFIRLGQALKAAKNEVHPNPAYNGDEAKQAFDSSFGPDSLKDTETTEQEVTEEDPSALQRKLAEGEMTELASRTSHDREALRRRRYLMNQAINGFLTSIVLFVAALSVYAVAGQF